MEKIINICKENKIKILKLEVREDNFAAIKLYESCGFKKCGIREQYYNGTYSAILMNYEIF